MESRAALSVETREAMAAVAASAAALADSLSRAELSGADSVRDADPFRTRADAFLDGLGEVARLEARTAALKARLTAEYARAAEALAPSAASPQERTAQEMSVVAEVACALTVRERSAGTLGAGS
ncbi:hypothetical protein QFZ65_002057 [Arthrobacter sp. B3I9]|nr:hypothetical protein [Arthrobacter sp. B3I9]